MCRVVLAVLRDDRPADLVLRLQFRKGLVVALPEQQPLRRDRRGFLQLCPQKRGDHFARQIGRAEVDPGVLVDLAAEEVAAVGALLAEDLGALGEAQVVDQQRPALAGDEVLGFVEAERGQRPKLPSARPW